MVVYKARHAKLLIGNAISVSTSSGGLYDQVSGTDFEQDAKNVAVRTPEGGTENIPLLGEDANGYQNEKLDKQRRGKATVTFDLVEGNVDLTQFVAQSTTTTGSATPYTFYNYGDDDASDSAVAVQFTDGTDIVEFLLNNANCINPGEVRVEGTGHTTRAGVAFECLARDFWEGQDIGN